MLDLNSEEWEWVVSALEYYENHDKFLWTSPERKEISALLHKIKDADVWGD